MQQLRELIQTIQTRRNCNITAAIAYISDQTGISQVTLWRWHAGTHQPSPIYLDRLSLYINRYYDS